MPFPFRVLSALFLLLLSAAPRHADERIRSFISAITIDDAGGLEVTETLDVQAEGWSAEAPLILRRQTGRKRGTSWHVFSAGPASLGLSEEAARESSLLTGTRSRPASACGGRPPRAMPTRTG